MFCFEQYILIGVDLLDVNEIYEILKQSGYKNSKTRNTIIGIMVEHAGYISAEEIFEILGMKINLSTIYRNLKLLDEVGLLSNTQNKGVKKYKIREVQNRTHDIICIKCGKTKSVKFCPFELMDLDESEFEIVGHKFEVYGICKHCK